MCVCQVIRISSRLQRLVRTFYLALPSLKNIGMFLLLILYVYAEMGNYLFSTVRLDHLAANTQDIARAKYQRVVRPCCYGLTTWQQLQAKLQDSLSLLPTYVAFWLLRLPLELTTNVCCVPRFAMVAAARCPRPART